MSGLIREMNTGNPGFFEELMTACRISGTESIEVRNTVSHIIDRVRGEGDWALLDYCRELDGLEVDSAADLQISQERMKEARERLDPMTLDALSGAINRVRQYHENQKKNEMAAWSYEDEFGNRLGQIVRPIERAGVYIPGGKASYPSTLIMTCIPARVAGVEELVVVSPAGIQGISDLVLATASLCGVDRFFTVGGAQAIAALAYGTETVPRVDKIVGPGNIYVATAKSMVFGQVGIDIIAGPSEVVILADESANTDWLVMDMFAQAEHDQLAQAILISPDQTVLEKVLQAIVEKLPAMTRSRVIAESLANRGIIIKCRDMKEATEVVNTIAPEHLELAVRDPQALLPGIRHAGAVFMGHYSGEALGDYTAGPSHVLPTSGAARFSSALSVSDFMVRSSVIECTRKGAVQLARNAGIIAREEGLEAHALSADYRCEG